MRTRIIVGLLALALGSLAPSAALASDPPVAIYHGTWTTAHWEGAPDECGFVFLGERPASGNWNVTILPGHHQAVVHMTMFVIMPDFATGGDYRVHIDSWGGNALGDFWTVDSVSANGFSLYLDLTGTPGGSMNTFALHDGTLTFAISPWVVPPFASCSAAVATGPQR